MLTTSSVSFLQCGRERHCQKIFSTHIFVEEDTVVLFTKIFLFALACIERRFLSRIMRVHGRFVVYNRWSPIFYTTLWLTKQKVDVLQSAYRCTLTRWLYGWSLVWRKFVRSNNSTVVVGQREPSMLRAFVYLDQRSAGHLMCCSASLK